MRAVGITAMLAVVALTLQIVGSGHERDEPLVVSRLILVESREVDRQLVEDTYRAELRHTGAGRADFARVTARLVLPFGLPFPGYLQIVDGDLEFGSVRAGQTVESRDTLTIRRYRQHHLKLHDFRWAIAGRPDLILSDAWAGLWRLTITSKNPETGSIAAVDDITDSLGAGEPVGFSLLPDAVRCTWTGLDHVLEADCRARFRFAGCLADGSAHFTIGRNASSLTGHGQWLATATGNCGPYAGSGGESIEIVGVRLGEQAEPEPFSPGVLTKVATTPAMAGFLADRLEDSDGGPPASDVDCTRGRWRRLTHPGFRNARECRDFVERHHGRHHEEGRR